MAKQQKKRKQDQPAKTDPVTTARFGADVVVIGANDSPRFYSNRVGLVSNLTDFSFSFQEILGFDEEKRVVSRELVRVYISALHAKAVRDLLDQQIAAYEQTFGKLATGPKAKPDGSTEPGQPS